MGGRLSGTVGSSTAGVDPAARGDAKTTDSAPSLVVLAEPLRRDVAIERTAEVSVDVRGWGTSPTLVSRGVRTGA